VIETVLGPVPAESLGQVSMHEHLLADSRALHRPGPGPLPADTPVGIDNLGFLRWNALALTDNLLLDDAALAATELTRAVSAGLGAVVDATSWGLGPRHRDLPALARSAGITIVSSYGCYIERIVPAWLIACTEAELELHLLAALDDHIPGTGFRAGLLGILGTTAKLSEFELRLLRAATRAAVRTGCAISVRLDPDARLGIEVLDICARAGLPADSVIFTNADEFLDEPYLADLAEAGAVLEMCFGNESRYHAGFSNTSDGQRIDFLGEFLARHPDSRWVLGCSVWTKAQLRHYGGTGYDHLLSTIVPALARRGVSAEALRNMLKTTPAGLLDRNQLSR
jgi:phosphotriesterase-related protein